MGIFVCFLRDVVSKYRLCIKLDYVLYKSIIMRYIMEKFRELCDKLKNYLFVIDKSYVFEEIKIYNKFLFFYICII